MKREGETMKFLGMGVLALTLAAVPTQKASAAGNFKFSVGFNLCFEYQGSGVRCGHGCFGQRCQRHQDYMAVMPGQDRPMPQIQPQFQPFPPPPNPERREPRGGDRKEEDTSLPWGYPSLGYSYYHPVSYYATQGQQNDPPATYYYPPQYSYPAYYGYPGYYQQPGMTFDR